MTTRNPIRVALLGTAIGLIPSVLFAQTDPMASQPQPGPPHQQSAPTSMQDSTAALGSTAQVMRDKIFLRKAVEGGMAEIQLGQLAAQKSDSPDVKAFGEKMVADHAAINDQMKPIAESMGVRAPKGLNKVDQAELDKLNGLSGSDFDTEYLTYALKDHHNNMHDFRDAALNASDPALKEAAANAEKTIMQHTMMVHKLAKDKGIPMPAHKPAPGSFAASR